MRFVVVDVIDDDRFELLALPREGVRSRSWRRWVPIQRSADVFATGVRTGVFWMLVPSVRKTSLKASVNWLPRSRTTALLEATASP